MPLEIPGYKTLEQIESGPRYDLYSGRDADGDNNVTIKVAKTEAAAQRLRHEPVIKHPNMIRRIHFGELNSSAYAVYEYLVGGSLQQNLRDGMHIQLLVKTIKDMARALDVLHSEGWVHADIKPENIMFRADGTAVLVDFESSMKIVGATPIKTHPTPLDTPSKHVDDMPPTSIIGSPEYMSPELATGRPFDGRTDFYSLGIVFYQGIYGELPYVGNTQSESVLKHLHDPIPRLPTYLAPFQPVIDKTMAKRAEQRINAGHELVQMLDDARIGEIS